MTKFDHGGNNRAAETRRLRSDAVYGSAKKQGQATYLGAQAKARAIAERYASVNSYCAKMAAKTGKLSKGQCFTLGTIEAEQRGLVRDKPTVKKLAPAGPARALRAYRPKKRQCPCGSEDVPSGDTLCRPCRHAEVRQYFEG